jgi:hypothetical protein
MTTEPKLESALTWDSEGHLAEPAVAALVDGELGILSEDAVRHAGECTLCAGRIADEALWVIDIADALHVRRPLPVWAMGVALATALVGLWPVLRDLPWALTRLAAVVVRAVPVLGRTLVHAFSQEHGRGLLATWWFAAAVLLAFVGIVVARVAPKPMQERGVL